VGRAFAESPRLASRVDFGGHVEDIAAQLGAAHTSASARVCFSQAAPRKNSLRKSTMYAVIKTGGKQYRVAAEDVLKVEKIAGDAGSTVEFTEVLMLAGSGEPKLGAPLLSGAKVTAEVVEQGRGPKLIAFKKRRRKNSRRKRGHRQELTTVRIKEIIGA
jgi:large subunit ribosomal protein L21